jgi:acylpyruvate hydrolase
VRLATVRTAEGTRVCVGTAAGLVDATAAAVGTEWEGLSLRELIAVGSPALAWLEALAASDAPVMSEEAVTFLPPVLDPPRVFCIGRNYAEHAKEGKAEVPDFPMIFLKPATSLVGHQQDIEVPGSTEKVDWEGEIAVIIGRGGRDIPEATALEHVAGYAVSNDVTARDWQRRTSQFDGGKMFDTFGPIGPYLVTPDEVADVADMRVETRVNGELMQVGNSGDMIFPMAMLVSYISQAVRLLPGDVILTGTPSGVGYARIPPIYLVPGDVVEVSVSGLGVLRNGVVAMEAAALGDPVGV